MVQHRSSKPYENLLIQLNKDIRKQMQAIRILNQYKTNEIVFSVKIFRKAYLLSKLRLKTTGITT